MRQKLKALRCKFFRRQVAAPVSDKDLARASDFLFRVGEHLLPLRDPTTGARDREQNREHRRRQTHGLIDHAGIEIDVRVELPLDEVFVFERNPFELQRDVEQRDCVPSPRRLRGDPLDDARAGIVVLVNAMTEAHQTFLRRISPA